MSRRRVWLWNALALSMLLAWAVPGEAASSLSGRITSKSGPKNARVWTLTVSNGAASPASSARITSFALTQTGGPACAPIVGTALPLVVGTIAPAGSAAGNVTIDFSSCVSAVHFRVDIAFTADSGATTGSLVRFKSRL